MKKIIIAVLAVAVLAAATDARAENIFKRMWKRGTTSTTTATSSGAVYNADCVVKALAKREAAIGAAYKELSKSTSAALETRATALSAAWKAADRQARVQGREAAWRAFKVSSQTARDTYKTAIRGTWAQFKSEAKACGSDTAGVEPEGFEINL